MTHAWLLLALAIALEVAGTTCLKLSDGLTRPLPSVLIFAFYGLSFGAMALALKRLDVSVAYAIWAGAGTGLIAAIGVGYFGEPMTPVRAASLLLVVIGVVGLSLPVRA